jgi:hypothetical protein
MSRLNEDRKIELEPKRIYHAIACIAKLGFEVTKVSDTEINFEFNGCKVYFFPYSGWHSGQSIKDGRGLQKLLNQLKTN